MISHNRVLIARSGLGRWALCLCFIFAFLYFSSASVYANAFKINNVYPHMTSDELNGVGYGKMKFHQWAQPKINERFKWIEVEVPNHVATCADGSPYRFFVNRGEELKIRTDQGTKLRHQIQITMEPGGACSSWESCTGTMVRRNPNGTVQQPASYIKDAAPKALIGPLQRVADTMWAFSADENHRGYAKSTQPMLNRLPIEFHDHNVTDHAIFTGENPFEDTKMPSQGKAWTLVHMPYCTGDIYIGNQERTFDAAYPEEASKISKPRQISMRFYGLPATMAVLSWIRQFVAGDVLFDVVAAGQSAGATGLDVLRPLFSEFLAPHKGFVALIDSGLLPRSLTVFNDTHRSQRKYENWLGANTVAHAISQYTNLHHKPITPNETSFTDPRMEGSVLTMLDDIYKRKVAGYAGSVREGDIQKMNLDSFKVNPKDRVLYIMAREDKVHPTYFFSGDNRFFSRGVSRDADINVKEHRPRSFSSSYGKWLRFAWDQEIDAVRARIDNQPNKNIGYFIMDGRTIMRSHCLTLGSYETSYFHDMVDQIDKYGVTRKVRAKFDLPSVMHNTITGRGYSDTRRVAEPNPKPSGITTSLHNPEPWQYKWLKDNLPAEEIKDLFLPL